MSCPLGLLQHRALFGFGLEEQFIGNKETHAILLNAEFWTLVQGGLSITDYCNKMKHTADALGTLGEPVLDRTLVLNVLRGLNDRYSHLAALITHTHPFPSFADVRADLLIEEVTMASKVSTPTALVASSSPSRPPVPHSGGAQGAPAGHGGQPSHTAGQGVLWYTTTAAVHQGFVSCWFLLLWLSSFFVLNMGSQRVGQQLQHHDTHVSTERQLVYGFRRFLSHGFKLRPPNSSSFF
jgi:hypothetical protein